MPKPELGTKRQCLNCGAKFFDLGKNPIICPKCGTVFEVAALPTRAPRAKPVPDEEPEAEPAGPELVPLEEADAGEDEKVAAVLPDDDIEVEDEAAEDDTFLEEEEEDSDDVTTLIDGDIEGDEER